MTGHAQSENQRPGALGKVVLGKLTLSDKNLTPYGKRQIAHRMCWRGHNFLKAALLLRRHQGDEWVALHCIGQAVELVLKGILLIRDFDKYKPELKKKHFGHDLEALEQHVRKELRLKRSTLPPLLRNQLACLNYHYRRHLLRYASGYALLVDVKKIESERVINRIARLALRLADEGGYTATISGVSG